MTHMGRQPSLRNHLVLLLVRLEICGKEGRNERQQLLLLRPSDKTTPGKQIDKQSRQHCSDICCNAIGVLLLDVRANNTILHLASHPLSVAFSMAQAKLCTGCLELELVQVASYNFTSRK
ncbi:unnamed protein product [Sphagnum jensenii]|uniref:Secreted protein n=1 Tax=Sphagnum jensenii TaxID=128206 RepID=A0ABP1AGG5_9BRYO